MRFFWVCFVSPDISSGNRLQGNQSGVLGQFQYPPLEESAKYSITWVRSVGSGIATRVDVYTKSSVYPYFHLESRLQRSHLLYHGKCDSFTGKEIVSLLFVYVAIFSLYLVLNYF